MIGYSHDALFGDDRTGQMSATAMSPAATGPQDWGAVLTTGILNLTQQAIQNKVNEATTSGQLVFTNGGVQVSATSNLVKALLIGAVIYFLAK